MSNHFHLVLTDTRGLLPAFMRDFLTNTSKALQVAVDIDRAVWSRKRYSSVHLLDLDAAERKIAYTVLNPTRAELTKPTEWPGLTSARWKTGETIRTRRPRIYYSKRYAPEFVELTLKPVGSEFGLKRECLIGRSERRIQAHVRAQVVEVRNELRAAGRTFASTAVVMRTSRQRRGTRRVRHRNPGFATTDRLALMLAIEDAREFEQDHARAKARYSPAIRERCSRWGPTVTESYSESAARGSGHTYRRRPDGVRSTELNRVCSTVYFVPPEGDEAGRVVPTQQSHSKVGPRAKPRSSGPRKSGGRRRSPALARPRRLGLASACHRSLGHRSLDRHGDCVIASVCHGDCGDWVVTLGQRRTQPARELKS